MTYDYFYSLLVYVFHRQQLKFKLLLKANAEKKPKQRNISDEITAINLEQDVQKYVRVNK